MNVLGSKAIDNKCNEIVKNVYLGSLKVALSKPALKRNGITHIL